MMADIFQQLLGPRPSLTIDIEQGFVTGLWVAGRRPDMIIQDFDLGASAPDASLDAFGAPFVSVNWHLPPTRPGRITEAGGVLDDQESLRRLAGKLLARIDALAVSGLVLTDDDLNGPDGLPR